MKREKSSEAVEERGEEAPQLVMRVGRGGGCELDSRSRGVRQGEAVDNGVFLSES